MRDQPVYDDFDQAFDGAPVDDQDIQQPNNNDSYDEDTLPNNAVDEDED